MTRPPREDEPENQDPVEGIVATSALARRVERLEREVEALRETLRERPRPTEGGGFEQPSRPREPTTGPGRQPGAPASGAPPGAPAADPAQTPPDPNATTTPGGAEPRRRGLTATDVLEFGEDWLGRIGIFLLLLGLAFLYRYAVDRGWITPELRVGFGLALGGGLLGFGLLRAGLRPRYSQVLLGGALAVLYLTGWAAHVLYGLVPWGIGFSFMAMVTVLAVALATRRRHQVLAVIGAAGGLATPFLLEGPSDAVTGLVIYAVLVLAGFGFLQLRRGWGVLLTVNFVGGMAVMAAAAGAAAGPDRFSAQAGIVAAWVVACAFPYLQGWLHARDRPPATPFDPQAPGVGAPPPPPIHGGRLWALTVGASSAAAVLTMVAWDLGRAGTGGAFLGAAAVVLAGSWLLRPHRPIGRPALGAGMARPALEAGMLLLVLGTALTAGGRWLPLPLALEAAGILWLARREDSGSLRFLAHAVFTLLAIDFLTHLQEPGDGTFQPYPLGVLGAMAVAAASAEAWLRELPGERRAYPFLSYAAFLAWLAWQLGPLPSGAGLTSAAWAICALVLLVAGARTASLAARMTGLATLALVAGKLLLVDLAAVDPGVRILLFLGFGAFFLLLGYVFRGRDGAR